MVLSRVELRSINGTQAALGWAGGHTVVVDRPEGKAGGQGLGFNGGQLLALALGGCFCNDLRYTAHAAKVRLGKIEVSVTIELEGDPMLAKSALMIVSCETLDGSDPEAIIRQAQASCMVSNSLQAGIPVRIESTS